MGQMLQSLSARSSDEMLESKQLLSDNVVSSSSEGWITELSTEGLKDLFTLRRDLLTGKEQGDIEDKCRPFCDGTFYLHSHYIG